MIKLSKIKIFKRAMLSVLSLAFLLGGAFFAAKMVKTFHVNAAEGDDNGSGSLNGAQVEITWSKKIKYDDWQTRDFKIKYSGTSEWLKAYCAQPFRDTPAGEMSEVVEIATPGGDDAIQLKAIKLLIYLADTADSDQGNPIESRDIMDRTLHFNQLGGGYDSGADMELRYAYVHAVIGYLYAQVYPPTDPPTDPTINDPMVGLTSEHRTLITDTIAPALENMITSSSDAWLIAQNSALYTISTQTQQMVWIKLAPQSGKIKIIKCDADNPNKCSGDKFKGTKFTIKNISGHRIYVPGAEGDNKFFDNGQVITTVTINDDTGQILVEGLPLGVKYRIEEISTSEYYYKPTDHLIKDITLTKNGATVEAKFNNKRASLGTTATDGDDGDKFVKASTTSVIKDVIEYCAPAPGNNRSYKITGVLYDKSTEDKILIDGSEVTQTIDIDYTNNCGTAEMTFELDTSELGGKDLVVYETLYLYEGKTMIEPITSHKDINDPSQTVKVVSLDTAAEDASDGDKTIIADKDAIITDRVKYCLVAGTEYVIVGTLMNKETGEPVKSNNEVVSSSVVITPEEDCGEIDMEFKFDATDLGGVDVVVFETAMTLNPTTEVYDTIVSHEDIDDEGQTIKIVNKTPETGIFTGGASSTTDGISIPVIVAAGVSVICAGTYVVARSTAKKRFFGKR